MDNQSLMADPELIKEFLEETKELIENLDNDLVSLESQSDDRSLIDRIFRAIHTIKGTSSFLGFDQLVEVSHAAEDILHLFRSGEKDMTSEVMDIILEATDKIKILVRQVRDNNIQQIDIQDTISKLQSIKENKPVESASIKEEAAAEEPVNDEKTDADAELEKEEAPKQPVAEKPPVPKKKEKSQPAKTAEERGLTDMDASTIRVAVDRLDDMMNLVGELVLERNRLLQINRDYRENQSIDDYPEKVAETTERIHFITTEIQLSVLKTRMVPIDRLFRKFPRLVRDIAREMNKKVELLVSGGETELDKTVIDQLGDPLVHLLRNSIDHGLEGPDERRTLGKPEVGRVELSARQEGNHIIIGVKDDGKGIDVEKIKAKALERELFTQEQFATMGKQDILQLIFEAGFSTAEKVSNISGRGVGMDVVRTNIRKLGGIIEMNSEVNLGTELILKLPLTLAIMQALMVQVEDDTYAIPLASVIETIKIEENDLKNVNQKEVIYHRDSVIPLLRMKDIFMVKDNAESNGKTSEYMVLVGAGEKRFGLVVDRLLGQEEVVIKSLGDYLGNIPGIAGGTITGDGRVRLIVDCANIAGLS